MASLFGRTRRRRAAAPSAVVHPPDGGAEVVPSAGGAPIAASAAADDDDDVPRRPSPRPVVRTFADLNLAPCLLQTTSSLGFRRPTPVQRELIPAILRSPPRHVLALSSTGSGKTAAFVLPILHTLGKDPYGIFATILTPTRELAKQIQEQVLALGSRMQVKSCLVVGGMDQVRQSCELDRMPHVVVATPGRLAELLRGPRPPRLRNVRYVVLDEADRLLSPKSGFERDVAEVLLHSTTSPDGDGGRRVRRAQCQTLLFSATLTRSLASLEEMAGGGLGRLPLVKYVIRQDDDDGRKKKKKRKRGNDDEGEGDESETAPKPADEGNGLSAGSSFSDDDDGDEDSDDEVSATTPEIPPGLRQEYVFMPSRVRDAYLLTIVRTLMTNGGRTGAPRERDDDDRDAKNWRRDGSGWDATRRNDSDSDDDDEEAGKARSAILFVSTCQRAALVSETLRHLGVDNVALHSLLSQDRRIAALGKFKSQRVRILVATDVASRGLDVPDVDLVVNSELPRRAVDYVHRVGRTARNGRRGRAVSLVGESDVALVHAAEKLSGRELEKCPDVTDDDAVRMMGPVTKATRLARMKLMDVGFDELVKKMKERKARDRRDRARAERAARKAAKRATRGGRK